MDNSFSLRELETAIDFSKKKSAPGFYCIDYAILRALPHDFRKVLLDIFNNLFTQRLFLKSWRNSLLILLPKADDKGVRPIALLLYILKRIIYRRLQWTVESQFILPEFQSGFRNTRSCTNNLIILTARIHSVFLCGASTAAVFLDIASAFDKHLSSRSQARIRLEIKMEIGLEFNQSEERRPI